MLIDARFDLREIGARQFIFPRDDERRIFPHAVPQRFPYAFERCGVYDAEELVKTTKLLLKEPPKFQGPWFFYSTYYTTVGMYQMGDDAWNRYYPRVDDALLKHQQPDGAWPEAPGNNEWDNGGPIYTTAMSLLALTVHYHLLPIYQR